MSLRLSSNAPDLKFISVIAWWRKQGRGSSERLRVGRVWGILSRRFEHFCSSIHRFYDFHLDLSVKFRVGGVWRSFLSWVRLADWLRGYLSRKCGCWRIQRHQGERNACGFRFNLFLTRLVLFSVWVIAVSVAGLILLNAVLNIINAVITAVSRLLGVKLAGDSRVASSVYLIQVHSFVSTF